jgi:hypothetical protein
MIIGYWDGKGFDSLVSGSAATQTAAVNAMISSDGNYYDYYLPYDAYTALQPDKSELPVGDEHPDNGVADFMKTSQSYYYNRAGWSWWSHVPGALTSYVHLVAPQYSATAFNQYWGTFTWEVFKAEIDAGRPVVLLVDSDGKGGTDHFVAAMGYSDDGGNRQYAARNTWNYGVHLYPFVPMQAGQPWGIYGATLFRIEALPGAFGKTSPSNGTWGQGSNVTLNWGDSSDATSYEYCFDNTGNSTCDGSWTSAASTSADVTGLTSGLIYYWQVRANNSAGSTYANGGAWWLWTTAPFPPVLLPLITR